MNIEHYKDVVDIVKLLARLRAWRRLFRITGTDLVAIQLDLSDFHGLAYAESLSSADFRTIQRVIDSSRAPVNYLVYGELPATLDGTDGQLLKSFEVAHEFALSKELPLDQCGAFLGALYCEVEAQRTSPNIAVYLAGIPMTTTDVARKFQAWKSKRWSA